MSIDAVYRIGEDALSNLWEINFGPIPVPGIGEIANTWALRAQNFNVPSSGFTPYEVHYKTHTIDRVNGKPEITREFAFDIRIDRYWAIYKALTIWKNQVFGTWDNVIGQDYTNATEPTNYRTDITVRPCGADGKLLSKQQLGVGQAWVFKGALIKTVGDVGLDYQAGDPITVNVSFSFLGMKDFLLQ